MTRDELMTLLGRASPVGWNKSAEYEAWSKAMVALIEVHCTDKEVAKELIKDVRREYTRHAAEILTQRHPEVIPQIAALVLLLFNPTT